MIVQTVSTSQVVTLSRPYQACTRPASTPFARVDFFRIPAAFQARSYSYKCHVSTITEDKLILIQLCPEHNTE